VLSGCVRVSEGTPVADPAGTRTTTKTLASPAPSAGPDETLPGITSTSRMPVPANSVTCPLPNKPPVSVAASVPDPAAPRVTVGVPQGWSFTAGAGEMAAKLQGPEGMSGDVTIAPTALSPDAAFRDYTDKLLARSPVSTVSILPAQLCEYSGLKLTGTWANDGEKAVEYVDRVVHVWTNGSDYLIGVHVEGPAGAAGLDAASDVVTDNVELTLP
jgi:hypothetical protein